MRIICDSHLRIPLESRLVQTAREQPVIVACLPGENRTKAKQLEKKGVTVWEIPPETEAEPHRNMIDLSCLMQKLGENKIDGILLEGGGTLNESALQSGIVSKVYCYLAPKIFGDAGRAARLQPGRPRRGAGKGRLDA